jgi:hypothetical protein
MRLLRDKQSVKRREPFPFRIGTKNRDLMNIFKQIHEGDGLKKHMFYHSQHKPLLTP